MNATAQSTRLAAIMAIVAIVATTLVGGCIDAPLPTPTQTNDARNHDPWLDGGEACPSSSSSSVNTQDESDGGVGVVGVAAVPVPAPIADLQIEDVTVGIGRVVELGNTVRVHYSASIAATEGGPSAAPKKIHDSHDDGPAIEIVVGSTKTMCGLDRALVGMHAGGERRVHVPWRLAFGERGHPPDIKPRTDLILVIDLFLPPGLGESHGSSGSPPPNPARGGGGGGGRRR